VTLHTAILVLLSAGSLAAMPPQRQAPDRMRPPGDLACDRDELTSYTGRVIAYRARADETVLRIRTDWDTTERVVVRHAGAPDGRRVYRIGGDPYTAEAWRSSIERRPGSLREGVRATAWICGGRVVRVDWEAGS
jgi:hypothetical protein